MSQYELIMELVINSNKEMKLFNWITNQFTKNRVETYITYSACKEDGIDISKSQFTKMVKILIDERYLMRIRRGIYRLNPFVYLPVMADAELLQREWRSLESCSNVARCSCKA
jgi:predicted transcriptional regulator of viral defense system